MKSRWTRIPAVRRVFASARSTARVGLRRSSHPRTAAATARLTFWWNADGEPASRVAVTLTETAERHTRVRIVETRPLEILDLVGLPLPGQSRPSQGPTLVAAVRMTEDPAGAVFGALAEPVRRRLLQTIAARPATATELADSLPISRQAVTKHLAFLSQAGLLERERHGRDVRYRLTPEPLSDAMSWMVSVSGQWDDRLERLRDAVSRAGSAAAAEAAGDGTSEPQ